MAYGQLLDCNSCEGKWHMGSYWTVTAVRGNGIWAVTGL